MSQTELYVNITASGKNECIMKKVSTHFFMFHYRRYQTTSMECRRYLYTSMFKCCAVDFNLVDTKVMWPEEEAKY
jgi:hypothetical protein